MASQHTKPSEGGKTAPSPAVAQAAAILRLLAKAGEPISVTAIARTTGVSQSSCFNLLKTLANEELVRFDNKSKLYSLGLGILQLARGVLGADAVLRAARPIMNALSARHEVTIGLWQATGRQRMTLVALGESTAAMRIHMEVGQRQPLGAGAAGRAWLSASDCSRSEMAERFAEVRWQQPLSIDDYLDSIGVARACGYAQDCEQLNRSIIALASPIRSRSGADGVLYVLSASTFARDRDADSLQRLGVDLALAADQLAATAVVRSP